MKKGFSDVYYACNMSLQRVLDVTVLIQILEIRLANGVRSRDKIV